MPTTTTAQGLPYPLGTDPPYDIDLYFQQLAEAVEKKLVQVYTDEADRDNFLVAPTTGMLVVLTVPKLIQFYDGAAWVQIYPSTEPKITSGTGIPANTTGKDGDVHFRV